MKLIEHRLLDKIPFDKLPIYSFFVHEGRLSQKLNDLDYLLYECLDNNRQRMMQDPATPVKMAEIIEIHYRVP